MQFWWTILFCSDLMAKYHRKNMDESDLITSTEKSVTLDEDT